MKQRKVCLPSAVPALPDTLDDPPLMTPDTDPATGMLPDKVLPPVVITVRVFS